MEPVNLHQQFDENLQQLLDQKAASGLLRNLVHSGNRIDFSSNDYFGFSQRPELHITETSLHTGSTGSRSITGNHPLAEATEALIAAFHEREAALIFNTGYMANVGLFSCLGNKGDTYLSDELIHASIIDGMRLSHANRLRFRHNDLADLEKKLRNATGRKIVVVESVYSMDGDLAPLNEIAACCEAHQALLVVDEAHATGVYGSRGEGLTGTPELKGKIYACIHTFGKALGLHGACITGSHTLRNFLLNQARSFIFTTALPPLTYLQLQAAYKILPEANRQELFQLIAHFRKQAALCAPIQFLESSSPIQGILIGDNFKARKLAEYLQEQGFFVRAILSPTVPTGKERIRICLHSFNRTEEVDALLEATRKGWLFIHSNNT